MMIALRGNIRIGSLVALLIAMPGLAFAGMQERQAFSDDVSPAIAKAQSAYQSACGCPLKINVDVDAGPMNMDEVHGVMHTVDDISDNIGKFCAQPKSKELMCKMSTLAIVKAPMADSATFSGNMVTANVDGNQHTSMEMIATALGNK